MNVNGKITTKLAVYCGRCEYWEPTDMFTSKQVFGDYLRLHGWRFTRNWGWICSDHNLEYEKMLIGE